MTRRVCFVFAALVLVLRESHQEFSGYETPPPLPVPDKDVIKQFSLALEAIFGVGIRLQAFLEKDEQENFLVSPISAASIIGQLILGAEGEFRKQLVDLLELPNITNYENDYLQFYTNNSKQKNVTYYLPYSTLHVQLSNLLKKLEGQPDDKKHFILTEKSALFLDEKVALNETFRKWLRHLYETRVMGVEFAKNPAKSQKTVNDWVAHNTNGLIKSILPMPPAPTTTSIFTNAIYFKANWELPFSDTLNRKGIFNVSATKSVPVTYMINQLDQIFYAESKDYRMIALPYANEELGMYIMLPRANSSYVYDVKSFVQNLQSLEILDTISRAKRKDVVVKLPKMQLSNSFSILDQLKKYRVFKKQHIKVNYTNSIDKLEAKVDAFANFTTEEQRDIYLTRAAVGQNLRVDDIVQQVVITVNEKGTEAAAVSAATINYMGGAKNFLVDRPFVFFIRHEATTATLFWGTVSNPTG